MEGRRGEGGEEEGRRRRGGGKEGRRKGPVMNSFVVFIVLEAQQHWYQARRGYGGHGCIVVRLKILILE